MTLVPLLLVPLIVSAGAPAPSVAPSLEQQGGRDFDAPPPGASREDQALWRAAYDVNNRILLERAAATRLQASLVTGRYEHRLDDLARRDAGGAKRAESLLKELAEAWTESADVLTRQWPVDPTRACRYPLLNFEGALYAGERSAKALHGAREDVEECVEKANLPLRALARSNERLRDLLARLDRELAPLAPATAAPAAADPLPAGTVGGHPGVPRR